VCIPSHLLRLRPIERELLLILKEMVGSFLVSDDFFFGPARFTFV